ncbi:hypothetical protein LWI28_021565 [Acer negundo]|uniref:Uncharacterized protein n=1 Tax=Acer negundo TaxID=4023 RepID=A0AAD5NM29_ACENE|nr:hypothetical protein LWI28_021565 [Acer negundo]
MPTGRSNLFDDSYRPPHRRCQAGEPLIRFSASSTRTEADTRRIQRGITIHQLFGLDGELEGKRDILTHRLTQKVEALERHQGPKMDPLAAQMAYFNNGMTSFALRASRVMESQVIEAEGMRFQEGDIEDEMKRNLQVTQATIADKVLNREIGSSRDSLSLAILRSGRIVINGRNEEITDERNNSPKERNGEEKRIPVWEGIEGGRIQILDENRSPHGLSKKETIRVVMAATQYWEERDHRSLLVERDLNELSLFPAIYGRRRCLYYIDIVAVDCAKKAKALDKLSQKETTKNVAQGATHLEKVVKTDAGTSASKTPHHDLPKDVTDKGTVQVRAGLFAPSEKSADKSPRLITLSHHIVLTDFDEEIPEKRGTPERHTDYFGKASKSSGLLSDIPLSVERATLPEQTGVIPQRQTGSTPPMASASGSANVGQAEVDLDVPITPEEITKAVDPDQYQVPMPNRTQSEFKTPSSSHGSADDPLDMLCFMTVGSCYTGNGYWNDPMMANSSERLHPIYNNKVYAVAAVTGALIAHDRQVVEISGLKKELVEKDVKFL